MLSAIRFAIADLRIRAIALALVLLGFTCASTIPSQSIIGMQQLGMRERQFGLRRGFWQIYRVAHYRLRQDVEL